MFETWMTENERNFIKSRLNKEDIMLEYGSGGSTLEFSPLVKSYYSVEHDVEWFNKAKAELAGKFNNLQCYLVPNDLPRSYPHVKFEEFKNYVLFAHDLGKQYGPFTKVLIDGRARIYCAEHIKEHITKKTSLFIHDWDRKEYHVVLQWYKVVNLKERLVELRLK